jgi:serine phosphatase RsbU (regulator of sigma subunit)
MIVMTINYKKGFIKIIILFIILFTFNTFNTQATTANLGLPFIRNYTQDEYQAHNQNWSVIQDQRGVMYFGNGNGLLEFDGINWRLISLPNNSAVRSLAMDRSGCIFVGGIGEFGYLRGNSQGQMTYISLLEKLDPADRLFNDVWDIAIAHGIVYFITRDQRVFLYKNESLSILRVSIPTYILSNPYDLIMTTVKDQGLCQIDEHRIIPLPGLSQFEDQEKYSIVLPYPDNKLLILFLNGDLYIYHADLFFNKTINRFDFTASINETNLLEKVNSPLPQLLADQDKNYIYHAIALANGHYALATFKNGLIFTDKAFNLIGYLNQDRGLHSNSIINLLEDKFGSLWAVHINGISRIDLHSPISRFYEEVGLKGVVLSYAEHNNSIYAGTFTGCDFLENQPNFNTNLKPKFKPVKGITSSCWNFLNSNGRLLAATSAGLFHIIEKDQAKLIDLFPHNYCLGKHPRFSDIVFIGHMTGLTALKIDFSEQHYPTVHYPFPEIKGGIRRIINDTHQQLWCTSEYNGIYVITFLADDIGKYKVANYGIESGLPANEWNNVQLLDDEILICATKGFYQLENSQLYYSGKSLAKFIPAGAMNAVFETNPAALQQIMRINESKILVNTTKLPFYLQQKNTGDFYKEQTPFFRLPKIDNFFSYSNQWVWFASAKGLFRFDLDYQKSYLPFHTIIRQVSIGREKIIFYGNHFRSSSKENRPVAPALTQSIHEFLKLPYRDNTVAFAYAALFFEDHEKSMYSFMLEGFDKKFSQWSMESKTLYTNLPENSYTFLVKSRNVYQMESDPAKFSFSIAPPWQRTIWSYFLYVFAFIGLIYGSIQLNSRRLILAKKKLEQIITERTHEVISQKDEIATQRDQLIVARNALWGEMELAKKIQTVLLPQNPVIPGYEITAYMQPADEVGGDYYDVISIDNDNCRGGSCALPQNSGQPQGNDLFPDDSTKSKERAYAIRPYTLPNPFQQEQTDNSNNQGQTIAPKDPSSPHDSPTTIHQPLTTAPEPSHWLSIGDVSGHGVPAGLIMMMVQTAIKTVAKTNPHFSPAETLIKVNEVIMENIRRMEEDKYMTITLMNINASGHIHYSGLHQDILVYRAQSKQVEIVETRGIWLGIMDNILDQLKVDTMYLHPGDVMLLYTDGIVEAMDSNHALYSDEQLIDILRQTGAEPLPQIQAAIVGSLENYSCNDDITFMIIKKN